VNALRERLERLADAGADGIELTSPTASEGQAPRRWAVPAVAGVAVVALVVVAVALAVAMSRGGTDDSTVIAAGGPDELQPAAVVAVIYGEPSISTPPVDLRFRFLDAAGEVFAERSWDEVQERLPGAPAGEVTTMRGVIQEVPAGELQLEATLQTDQGPVSCTQPFTAAADDQLILRVQLSTESVQLITDCASVGTVDDWVQASGQAPASGPIGETYLGLTVSEAEAQASADGLTTRVVGRDGMNLFVTADLRCDRLDLKVFDDVVVAADLPAESSAGSCQSLG
jgi:hypothetical protein